MGRSGKYTLLGEWKTSSAGKTALAEYGGKKYFLKKYSQFKVPTRGPSTSERLYNQKLEDYNAFKNNRIRVMDALKEVALGGGNIICPVERYEDDNAYVEATLFIDDLIEYEEILRMPNEEKLFIMSTAAHSLKTIHGLGIIHSDLKISNVMAARMPSGKKVAKIIDFDKSYFKDNVREDELGGDELYFSPELAICIYTEINEETTQHLSTKSDIFSLGLIFHNYLTNGAFPRIEGEAPYCGQALAMGLKIRISDDIKDKRMRDLIAAMLNKDPSARPDAGEVFSKLKEIISSPEADTTSSASTTSVVHTAPILTAPTAPTPPTRPVEVVIPEGFCEPWEDHKIEFILDKFKSNGFIASERVEISGKKAYYFYKEDGQRTLYALQRIEMLNMCKKKEESIKNSTVVISSGEVVRDEELFWPPDAGYVVDEDVLQRAGYVKIEKFINSSGIKCYRIVSNDGSKRSCTFQYLKMLGYVKKKD